MVIDPATPGNVCTYKVPPLLVYAASWDLGMDKFRQARGLPALEVYHGQLLLRGACRSRHLCFLLWDL